MSWFDSVYSRKCVPVLLSKLGEETVGLYTDGSDVIELRGIVTNEAMREEEDDSGIVKRRECDWIVTTDPEGPYGGLARVELKGTVTLNGEIWSVESVEAQSASTIRMVLVQLPRRSSSRKGLRQV